MSQTHSRSRAGSRRRTAAEQAPALPAVIHLGPPAPPPPTVWIDPGLKHGRLKTLTTIEETRKQLSWAK